MREIDESESSDESMVSPSCTVSGYVPQNRRKPSRIRGLAFFGYMKLFPYFFGRFPPLFGGDTPLLQPMDRKLPQQGVQYTAQGINTSIPRMPMRLPPTVTAASTQMEGSPTEEPTTWG